MKKFIFSIFNLFLIGSCFGQNVKLDGEILDAETNKPLLYATIEIFSLKTGTITNENGQFNLEVVTNDLKSDTIEFSYLGYERMKTPLEDFYYSNNRKIFLKEKSVTLDEIKVVPKKYTTSVVGIKDKKPEHLQYSNVFGANKGNFISNKKKETGWIKSVSYYITSDGYPNTPFRVRIFSKGNNNKPGNDLLNDNIVVSAIKSGWFNVDISAYNIPFPNEGAFVMMEWINSGVEFYFEKEIPIKGINGELDKMGKKKYYGQSLGTVSKKGGVVMWGNNLGNEWIPYDFNYKENYTNAMINVEIAYEIK